MKNITLIIRAFEKSGRCYDVLRLSSPIILVQDLRTNGPLEGIYGGHDLWSSGFVLRLEDFPDVERFEIVLDTE
jgi:hypothetical protein